MRSNSVRCLNGQGFHRMAYHEWGCQANEKVLVCVHGLARNGRDFDDLAKALARDYRVVCPDIVGRGGSDWLPAAEGYGIAQYLNDMTTLLGRLDVEQVDWVGTSMGGIIGICLAALPNSPIRSLVLNDIGARIPARALQRIAGYLGARQFDSLAQVERFLRRTYPALRKLEARQWRHLASHGSRAQPDGRYALHYDPALATAAAAGADQDIELWGAWRAVRCPQLLIWGERSDVLEETTVRQMQQENPALELYAVAGTEHAPSLMEPAQIQRVQAWLRQQRID